MTYSFAGFLGLTEGKASNLCSSEWFLNSNFLISDSEGIEFDF
jgi:hypothetical protein